MNVGIRRILWLLWARLRLVGSLCLLLLLVFIRNFVPRPQAFPLLLCRLLGLLVGSTVGTRLLRPCWLLRLLIWSSVASILRLLLLNRLLRFLAWSTIWAALRLLRLCLWWLLWLRLLTLPSVGWPLSRLLLLLLSWLHWLLTGLLRTLGLLLGCVRDRRLVASVSKQWLIWRAWLQSARSLNELTLLVVLRTLRIILRIASKHRLWLVSSLRHSWLRFYVLLILTFGLWIFLTFTAPCPWFPLLLVILVGCLLLLLVEILAMVSDEIIHHLRLVIDDFSRVSILSLSDIVRLMWVVIGVVVVIVMVRCIVVLVMMVLVMMVVMAIVMVVIILVIVRVVMVRVWCIMVVILMVPVIASDSQVLSDLNILVVIISSF